jgi:hypothetical protein
MELLEIVSRGIQTGEMEVSMLEVILWFVFIMLGMGIFFIWESLDKK